MDPKLALPSLFTSFGFAIVSFLVTLYLIPALGQAFVKAGLKGKDMSKTYQDDMYVVSILESPRSLTHVCVTDLKA